MYTDEIQFQTDDDGFTLDLMKKAKSLRLTELVDKCEETLISSVNVKNCIRFYATADEINATTLRDYCSQLISSHWVRRFSFKYSSIDFLFGGCFSTFKL